MGERPKHRIEEIDPSFEKEIGVETKVEIPIKRLDEAEFNH